MPFPSGDLIQHHSSSSSLHAIPLKRPRLATQGYQFSFIMDLPHYTNCANHPTIAAPALCMPFPSGDLIQHHSSSSSLHAIPLKRPRLATQGYQFSFIMDLPHYT
eukprot:c31661_g1_i1 orf=295-609(+)